MSLALKPVILAGGAGSRLWPLSRLEHPKQFISLDGVMTMLQATARRLSSLPPVTDSIVVCNQNYRFTVAEQLREIDAEGLLVLEPTGKDSAPAVAVAAFSCEDEDPVLLVMPADHRIKDEKSFSAAISTGIPLAEAGDLVTFGIVPTDAHTGYGYIETDGDICSDLGFTRVASFREKPNFEVAQEYVSSGNYLWNSGIFLFRASRYLEELRTHRPLIYEACRAAFESRTVDQDFQWLHPESFEDCPSESIDYAVFENSENSVVVPLDAGWSDIGSWRSFWEASDKDDFGNAKLGDVIFSDTTDSLGYTDGQLLVGIGLADVAVVCTHDAVLVTKKSDAEKAKQIAQSIAKKGRVEAIHHREVHRPWGKFESICRGDRYQVKKITVKPGASLSLQMHYHRSEHWVIVSGTASVTTGDSQKILGTDESIYIKQGSVHALGNPGKMPLELIEIQTGDYLGEDDIVRFEDRYGRV